MYVTTFYSYKGGVGRTMALVNVAYLLASAGKRVLVVDFDLEAPGLSSYGPFRCAGDHPGIVEYVLAYLDENAAPDVGNYIMECQAGTHPIWLMPAGRHTDLSYAAKYSSIGWQNLYREHDGFLLFEDMRQQWEQYQGSGFDYVLIDSRTGHTDIGGICTRQLPDAVVIQFLPTAQNLDGLLPIVQGIRGQGTPVRRTRVRLLFCPSNLPDGDDQELILKRALDRARATLGYKQVATEIYHYAALDLLEQPLYSQSSPNSRLSGEYGQLHRAIISANLEDRDGAVIALERMLTDLQMAMTAADKTPDESFLQRVRSDAAFISGRFPQDVDVQWQLAMLASMMTRPEDELAALTVVIEASKSDVGLALLRRAGARASLDDTSGAVDDLERLLTCEVTTYYEVAPAAELLRRLKPDQWRDTLEAAVRNRRMASGARAQLVQTLLTEREQVPRLVELARSFGTLREADSENAVTSLTLALIADGQFEAAMSVIAPDRAILLARSSMPDLFNYGICEWATTAEPPHDLFAKVLEIRNKRVHHNDLNGLQCFALCQYLLSQPREALDDLKTARLSAPRVTSAFSCWRYLTVTAQAMLEDLDEMQNLFSRSVTLLPPSRDGLKGSNRV